MSHIHFHAEVCWVNLNPCQYILLWNRLGTLLFCYQAQAVWATANRWGRNSQGCFSYICQATSDYSFLNWGIGHTDMETRKVTFTVSLKGGVCFNMRLQLPAITWNWELKKSTSQLKKPAFKKKAKPKETLVNKDARVKQSTKAGQSMEWYLLW